MKAIQLTQDLKNNNKEFFINNNVGDIVQKSIPIRFHGVENILGDYRTRNDLHLLDGWKDIVLPTFDNTTQRRGNKLIDHPTDETKYTYEVFDLTESEVISNLRNNIESEREQVIQEKIKQKIVEDAQLIVDDTEALENSVLYPFWEAGIIALVGEKYQHFVGTELRLYRVVQEQRPTQFEPQIVPALFTRVAPPGVIPDWVQPTGAQDAYQIGDKVNYDGQVWISLIDTNTTVPDGDVPFNRYWEPFDG